MANSEFAKRQMRKHGWTEGSGLGKEEDGMAEPIKVSLKMDKTGVGHDPGKEFTDHWWLRVFNEAAQKIGTKPKNGSVASETAEEKAKSKKEQQRKNFYKGFVQSATLTNGVEEKTVSSDTDSEDERDASTSVSIPTLDDIHQFCGGATGHRAASFGIKMEGKIKRASHHEKKFEEIVCSSSSSTNVVGDKSLLELETDDANKRKKRKKKKSGKTTDSDTEVVNSTAEHETSKKTKREGRNLENGAESVEDIPTKKRKKKGAKISECDIEVVGSTVEELCEDAETRKRKTQDLENGWESFENIPTKKSKKKDAKADCDIEVVDSLVECEGSTRRKKESEDTEGYENIPTKKKKKRKDKNKNSQVETERIGVDINSDIANKSCDVTEDGEKKRRKKKSKTTQADCKEEQTSKHKKKKKSKTEKD